MVPSGKAGSIRNSTKSRMKVWYKLDDEQSTSIEVKEGAIIVDDLKKAIKTEWGDDVPHAAARLRVFAAGADPSTSTPLEPYITVPTDTTGQNPLIVVSKEKLNNRPPLHPNTTG